MAVNLDHFQKGLNIFDPATKTFQFTIPLCGIHAIDPFQYGLYYDNSA